MEARDGMNFGLMKGNVVVNSEGIKRGRNVWSGMGERRRGTRSLQRGTFSPMIWPFCGIRFSAWRRLLISEFCWDPTQLSGDVHAG